MHRRRNVNPCLHRSTILTRYLLLTHKILETKNDIVPTMPKKKKLYFFRYEIKTIPT